MVSQFDPILSREGSRMNPEEFQKAWMQIVAKAWSDELFK
jgi:hypothetical protein